MEKFLMHVWSIPEFLKTSTLTEVEQEQLLIQYNELAANPDIAKEISTLVSYLTTSEQLVKFLIFGVKFFQPAHYAFVKKKAYYLLKDQDLLHHKADPVLANNLAYFANEKMLSALMPFIRCDLSEDIIHLLREIKNPICEKTAQNILLQLDLNYLVFLMQRKSFHEDKNIKDFTLSLLFERGGNLTLAAWEILLSGLANEDCCSALWSSFKINNTPKKCDILTLTLLSSKELENSKLKKIIIDEKNLAAAEQKILSANLLNLFKKPVKNFFENTNKKKLQSVFKAFKEHLEHLDKMTEELNDSSQAEVYAIVEDQFSQASLIGSNIVELKDLLIQNFQAFKNFPFLTNACDMCDTLLEILDQRMLAQNAQLTISKELQLFWFENMLQYIKVKLIDLLQQALRNDPVCSVTNFRYYTTGHCIKMQPIRRLLFSLKQPSIGNDPFYRTKCRWHDREVLPYFIISSSIAQDIDRYLTNIKEIIPARKLIKHQRLLDSNFIANSLKFENTLSNLDLSKASSADGKHHLTIKCIIEVINFALKNELHDFTITNKLRDWLNSLPTNSSFDDILPGSEVEKILSSIDKHNWVNPQVKAINSYLMQTEELETLDKATTNNFSIRHIKLLLLKNKWTEDPDLQQVHNKIKSWKGVDPFLPLNHNQLNDLKNCIPFRVGFFHDVEKFADLKNLIINGINNPHAQMSPNFSGRGYK